MWGSTYRNNVYNWEVPVPQQQGFNAQAYMPQAPSVDTTAMAQNANANNTIRPLNVTTGVMAGPVYSQPQVAQALGSFGRMAPAGNNATANALYKQMANQSQIGASRQMSEANAAQMLNSQTARASAGNQWGQMQLRDISRQQGENQRRNQMAYSLLQSLMGW